jgi:hypothetical protein
MTSQRSAPAAHPGSAASGGPERGYPSAPDDPPSRPERSERADISPRQTGTFPKAPPQPEGSLDSAVVDELTRRLPTSELVKIIKGALEFGHRNQPFTESDFLRAMTFGASALAPRQPPRGPRTPR